MGPDAVVVLGPVLDHDPGFEAVPEPFDRQAFIAELAVEAFCCPVLPRLSRIDQRTFYPLRHEPFERRRADELGA